jgi:hypothetical protein
MATKKHQENDENLDHESRKNQTPGWWFTTSCTKVCSGSGFIGGTRDASLFRQVAESKPEIGGKLSRRRFPPPKPSPKRASGVAIDGQDLEPNSHALVGITKGAGKKK